MLFRSEKLLNPDQIEQAKRLQDDWKRLRTDSFWPFDFEILEEFNFDVAAFEKKVGIDLEAEKRLQQNMVKFCDGNKKCSKEFPLDELKKLAADGNPIFQNNFGWRLYEVATGKQQKSEAFRYFLKAAQSGSAHAQVAVGWIYLHGLVSVRDVRAAFEWSMKGARQGHPEGANNIAFQYENGIGVQKNFGTAKEWYTYAATRGSQSALGALRHMITAGK